mmetsp:Transcript_14419/g.12232  ORF Transcript_14419/g.12232 Transcript_14419/m.12232 type:complete len:145 (+) Transcript_14419:57-491(+)
MKVVILLALLALASAKVIGGGRTQFQGLWNVSKQECKYGCCCPPQNSSLYLYAPSKHGIKAFGSWAGVECPYVHWNQGYASWPFDNYDFTDYGSDSYSDSVGVHYIIDFDYSSDAGGVTNNYITIDYEYYSYDCKFELKSQNTI